MACAYGFRPSTGRHKEPGDALSSTDSRCFYVNLLRSQFRALQEASIFRGKFSKMTALHNRADMVPRFTAFPLGNADEKEREVAEKHMGFDALVLAMIERPELKCRLQRPGRLFLLP